MISAYLGEIKDYWPEVTLVCDSVQTSHHGKKNKPPYDAAAEKILSFSTSYNPTAMAFQKNF